tara:strand:+ start:9741 stop:10253 length:513 start_codon:yes stop_codon:yes gene_type:complete
MSSNYKQSYKKRATGLASEKAKEFYYKAKQFVRPFGFEEDEVISLHTFMKMPRKIRKMPDYIYVDDGKFVFSEVKGCHDILRLKLEDLEDYLWWWKTFRNDQDNVYLVFFVYSTKSKLCHELTIQGLVDLINNNTYERDTYPDNNKVFIKIPYEDVSDRAPAIEFPFASE